jgi:phospholipid transport system substrate-binding protein
MPRRRDIVLAAAAILLGTPLPAVSQTPPRGDAWLRRVLERATDILTSPGTDSERRQAFGRLLADEVFEFAGLVRYVLGNYWNQATEAQRREFSEALRDYLIAAYARILRRWFAGDIDVFASRLEKDGLAGALNEELARAEKTLSQADWSVVDEGEVVLVFARFKPRDAEPMRTMVRLVKRLAEFRIVDLWINGVSIARTHRDDIAAVIRAQSGNLNATIGILRRKTAQLQGA